MSASDKHVLDYEGLQYFKTKIYSDLKTINGAAITGGGNLSLVVANSAITGATKCKITYDSKGLVTGGADLAASDLPSNYGDSKNPYASKTANYVLAAPNGSAGVPSFRKLVAADIPSLAAGKITSGTFAVDRIPSLAASKITSGTFAVDRIPSLAISKITDLQTTLDAKYVKPSTGIPASDLEEAYLLSSPDGINNLIDNNKISVKYLPDVVLGQLVFGGTVTGAGVATLSTNAKTKLGTTSSSITLTNNTTAITGYKANEGIFYVVTSNGSFASLGLKTGDWLISTGDAWRKIDNTDEVTSVQIKGTANVLSSSTATAQTGAVVTTLNLVAGHGDTVNPYGTKTRNFVLAAPTMAAGVPSFRELVPVDIPDLDASKITRGTFADERIASAATWNAKYYKPSTGIPASDLEDSYVVANSAITGATKCKITYDSKGLVTGGADLSASDIPSLAASKITSGTFDAARIPSLAISKITNLQATLDEKYVKPANGIPSSDLEDTIVTSVNGSSGAITNVAKTNVDNVFTAAQTMHARLDLTTSDNGRATIRIITATNDPNDLYFGSSGVQYWSLTSRATNESNAFCLYDVVAEDYAASIPSNGNAINIFRCLNIYSNGYNFNEGIRIHPSSGWTTLMFCEASNSGDSGTSANTWSIHNNEGNFGLYKNGSTTSASMYLSNQGGDWILKGSTKSGVIATTSEVVLYNGIINTGASSPATGTKNYWSNLPTNSQIMAYNSYGNEFSFIFSKNAEGTYGTILKWGHSDNYIYMLRHANNWMSDDWQKISAGYADSTYFLASRGPSTWADEALSGDYGITVDAGYSTGYPTSYGNVIKIHGSGDGVLWCDWIEGGKLFYNARRDMNSQFWGWKEIAFKSDIPAAGTKLYQHTFYLYIGGIYHVFSFITTSSSPCGYSPGTSGPANFHWYGRLIAAYYKTTSNMSGNAAGSQPIMLAQGPDGFISSSKDFQSVSSLSFMYYRDASLFTTEFTISELAGVSSDTVVEL